jgi:hypothetical protein
MKSIRRLSDRLLSLAVPKIEAEAASPVCTESGWCQLCRYEGSLPLMQHCWVYAVCRVECGICLINNPDC